MSKNGESAKRTTRHPLVLMRYIKPPATDFSRKSEAYPAFLSQLQEPQSDGLKTLSGGICLNVDAGRLRRLLSQAKFGEICRPFVYLGVGETRNVLRHCY